MPEPKKYLQALGLTESEIAVYLAMVSGVLLARNLVKVTGLKRPTVYYALGCLEKRGLLSKTEHEGAKQFSLAPIAKLELLVDEKLQEAQALKATTTDLLPLLQSTFAPVDQKPTVAFFEGTTAVKRAIMEMLWCKDKQINSVVPQDNFFWQVGKGYVAQFVEERKKRSIKTKNLWDVQVEKSIIKKYYEGLSEIRIVPAAMRGKFKTAVFLFDDKVLSVSSLKNDYCVLITSQEYHDTMQAWFDGLWSAAKPHKK